MVRRTTKKGGFLGLATAAALRYGVPLAVKYLRSRGKKSRKGSGTKMLGSSKCNCKHGKGLYRLGRGVRRGGKRGMYLLNEDQKENLKTNIFGGR